MMIRVDLEYKDDEGCWRFDCGVWLPEWRIADLETEPFRDDSVKVGRLLRIVVYRKAGAEAE